jgi:hypothetical protein
MRFYLIKVTEWSHFVFVTDATSVLERNVKGPLAVVFVGSSDTYSGPVPTEKDFAKVPLGKRVVIDCTGYQYTESRDNGWRSRDSSSDFQDIGSDFFTKKSWVETSNLPHSYLTNVVFDPGDWEYEFTVARGQYTNATFVKTNATTKKPINFSSDPLFEIWRPNFPPDLSSDKSTLEDLGTTAIARCSPGNPVADLAVTLGELTQGLPKIPGASVFEGILKKMKPLKKLGDEWLNFFFGLKPLLSDLGKISDAMDEYDRILEQFERDAGRHVRRSYRFPTETSTTTTSLSGIRSPLAVHVPVLLGFPSVGGFAPCETLLTREITRRVWFDGAFQYSLPDWFDSHDKEDREKLRRQLALGSNFDWETLWNLAPWSWLIDWFTNVGDLITNLQRFADYDMAVPYGYLMENVLVSDTYTIGPKVSPFGRSCASSIRINTETKKRVQAGPFGFGINWDGLSAFQLSILAALGITRGRR